jgi:hypothetical protein
MTDGVETGQEVETETAKRCLAIVEDATVWMPVIRWADDPTVQRALDAVANRIRQEFNLPDYDGPNVPGWEGGFARNH